MLSELARLSSPSRPSHASLSVPLTTRPRVHLPLGSWTTSSAPLVRAAQAARPHYHVPRAASGPGLEAGSVAALSLADRQGMSNTEEAAATSTAAQPTTSFSTAATVRPPTGVSSPADGDLKRFKLHPTVEIYAMRYNIPSALAVGSASTSAGPESAAQSIAAEVAGHLTSGNPQALLYWSYHVGRHLFFLSQGAAGVVAHRLTGTSSGTIEVKDPGKDIGGRLTEVLATFLQDWEAIQAGTYKLPWDMTTPAHPDNNPLGLVTRSAAYLGEAIGILDRLSLQQPEQVWLRSPLYPPYFQNSYHYQADGWLSSRSAEVYEHTTEVVFLGSQDAMQRNTLLPLASHLAGKDASQLQLLEVAAGTGRFHTFIKDNWPELQTTITDLSPFYLDKARSNMQAWKRLRAAGRQLGGVDGTGTTYIQCSAESLSVEDDSQDVVVCVYLFHELPQEAREASVKEMFRVLKPGGLAVLTDSVQLGDRPAWDADLSKFGQLDEPYFESYIACDLGEMFEGAGFACDTKYMRGSTKTLTFFKPAAGAATSG